MAPSQNIREAAKLLAARLEELGAITDEPGQLTRTFLSPAMRRANDRVGAWMSEAGLAVREDETGNVIGRLEASPNFRTKSRRRAGTLCLGSHLDTVRNAGRFDGPVGVVLPLMALTELRRRGVTLPFAVEVVGFSEEEGLRFAAPYLGSKGYIGKLTTAELARRDDHGTSVADAMARWQSAGARSSGPTPRRGGSDLLGYLEVHIEQGPVLEAADLAVGTVSAIASQRRGRLVFRGQAGHAGTTPMDLRRDALVGAAEFVVAVENYAAARRGLVATVGTLEVPGGAGNVIPGECVLSLDVRHADERRCRNAVMALVRQARQIARRRGLRIDWRPTLAQGATRSSPQLTSLLAASVRAVQGRDLPLVSGAGHDAVVMAGVTEVSMLFVRCRGGLSHHPDEYASPKDLGVALAVVIEFLERLAKRYCNA